MKDATGSYPEACYPLPGVFCADDIDINRDKPEMPGDAGIGRVNGPNGSSFAIAPRRTQGCDEARLGRFGVNFDRTNS